MITRKDNIVAGKSLNFAVRIVNLCRLLNSSRHEKIVSSQILRSGTSIGANIREANSAQSKADFISKVAIVLNDETGYWLELLYRTKTLSQKEYDSIFSDNQELFAQLPTILKSARRTTA